MNNKYVNIPSAFSCLHSLVNNTIIKNVGFRLKNLKQKRIFSYKKQIGIN